MRKTLTSLTLAAVLLSGGSLAGCVSQPSGYVEAPPAYGANGFCYWVDDPYEVDELKHDGLCPVNWAPAHIPSSYYNQYYWFYSSPRYTDHYIIVSHRTTYKVYVQSYAKTNTVRTSAPRIQQPRSGGSNVVKAGNSGRQGADKIPAQSPAPVSRKGGSVKVKSGKR